MKNKFDSFKVGESIITYNIVAEPIHANFEGFRKYRFSNSEAEEDSYNELKERNPRKKNIYRGNSVINGTNSIERFETINYKGAFRGYKGSNLYCDYQSCIAISNCGTYAITIIGNKIKGKYVAPKGMLFKKDNLGIFVERQTDKMDYHLMSVDWDIKNFATKIREKMASEYIKRKLANKLKKANEQHEKLFIKSLRNTRVNLNDSRKAGNCLEGTLSFCEKYLKLDRKTILDGGHLFSIPATSILKKAKNEFDEVRALNACRFAWMRETTISI